MTSIDVTDCWWYHSMDIPAVGSVTGQWDLRSRFADYIANVDLRGKRVLDVGTASGFLTFEAERAGAAEVISFDAESHKQIQYLPGYSRTPEMDENFRKMRSGYQLAHRQFSSRAKPVYGDIYRMAELVPVCDVVMIGQILVHLRDPLSVLEEATKIAKEKIIIVEGMPRIQLSVMQLLGETGYAWWHISEPLYRKWFALLGFGVTVSRKASFRCSAQDKDVELTTLVVERGAPTTVVELEEEQKRRKWPFAGRRR